MFSLFVTLSSFTHTLLHHLFLGLPSGYLLRGSELRNKPIVDFRVIIRLPIGIRRLVRIRMYSTSL